jgi:hypothetical protein
MAINPVVSPMCPLRYAIEVPAGVTLRRAPPNERMQQSGRPYLEPAAVSGMAN